MDFVYMDLEDGPIQIGGACSADGVELTDASVPNVPLGGQR